MGSLHPSHPHHGVSRQYGFSTAWKRIIPALLASAGFMVRAQPPDFCSQNLVPNHDFELHDPELCSSSLPGIGQLWIDTSRVVSWYGTSFKNGVGSGITPDHYNSECVGNTSVDCMQGSSSVGVYTSTSAGVASGSFGVREHIQCELLSPLEAGQVYHIEMTVRSGAGSFWAHTDGFGVWFRQASAPFNIASQNGISFISADPQFENPQGNIIGNECQTISGYFCATGGENWMILGNFRTDSEMTVGTSGAPAGSIAYVIVDEVFVRKVCGGTAPPLLEVVTSSESVSCGQAVTVNVQQNGTSFGPVQYAWTSPPSLSGLNIPGPFTQNLTSDTSFSLSYTATGACGTITGNSTVLVDLASGAGATPVSILPESCPGECDGAVAVQVSGGTPPFVISWSNATGAIPGNTTSQDNLCMGEYQVHIVTTETILRTDTLFTEDFQSGSGQWILGPSPTGGVNAVNANFWEITTETLGPTVATCDPVTSSMLNLGCSACSPFGGYGTVNTSVMAQSTALDLTGYSQMQLSFDFLGEQNPGNAQGALYVNTGSGWNFLTNLVSPTCWGPYNGWGDFSIALPPAANNNPGVQIGFYWFNNTYIIPEDWGLAVDNILLTGQTPVPVQCTATDTLQVPVLNCTGCDLSAEGEATGESCTGLGDGEIHLDLSGSSVYDVWMDGTLVLNSVPPGAYVLPGISPGNVTVHVYDALQTGCDQQIGLEITPGASPPDAGSDGTAAACANGQTVSLADFLGGNPEQGGAWSPATAQGLGLFNPLLDDPGIYTYSLGNACGIAEASVTVTLTNAPDAGVSGGIELCANGNAAPLSSGLTGNPDPGGTWTPSTAINGQFDPATDSPGTYTYQVSNACGIASAEVHAEVISVTPDIGTSDETTCGFADGAVQAMLANTTFSLFTDPGQQFVGSNATGTFSPLSPGDYILVSQTGSCTPVSIPVAIGPAPPPGPPQVSGGGTYCPGDEILLTASSPDSGLLRWFSDAALTGLLEEGDSFSPQLPPGSYTYFVAAGDGSCQSAAATVTMLVDVLPEITSLAGPDAACPGEPVYLESSGAGQPLWFNGVAESGTTISLMQEIWAVVTYTTGCGSTSDSLFLFVYDTPDVTAGPDTTISPGQTASLTASGALSYLWSPSAEVSCADCSTTLASPAASQEYVVVGTDENGCRDSDTVWVFVSGPDYDEIPNVFAPDGDGWNDTFSVPGRYSKYELLIFNRWGQLVFEGTPEQREWDGQFRGQPSPEGVYVYRFRGATLTGESRTSQGNLTLLR